MKREVSPKLKLRRTAGCGVLIAVAVILQYIEISIPLMPSFIKLDFSDLPEIIGAFAYGPVAGCEITILKNIIHMAMSQSGFVGELSNAVLGCVFSFVCGFLYESIKTRKGALISGICGALTMAAASFPLNMYVTYPLYFTVLNFPQEAVMQMYQAINPAVTSLSSALIVFNVPFTFLKGIADVALCMGVYKRISPILHGKRKVIATISGRVVHGKGLGHRHGMPTANIDCNADSLKKGVYGGIAHIDGRDYRCLVNIGTRPSVDDDPRITTEAYLLEFDGNLYDRTLSVDLLIYIRKTKKFSSIDEVRKQIERDIRKIRSLQNG